MSGRPTEVPAVDLDPRLCELHRFITKESEPMNTTPTIRQMLLALAVGFAVTGAVLLLLDRNSAAQAGAQTAESCGPQDLTVHEGTATVDPDGCEVELVVFQAAPDAVEVCPDIGGCIMLPQIKVGYVSGTGPLTLPLPECGWYQVDVFDVGLLATLEELTADIVNDPAALLAWGNAHPEYFEGLLAGAVGETGVVCTPHPEPVVPPVDVGVKPLVIERPPAAVPVVAEPQLTG